MASRKNKKSKKSKGLLGLKLQLGFSLLLIILGFVLIFFAAYKNYGFRLTNQLPKSVAEQHETSDKINKIASINIPKIKRDLKVEDGSYVNGRWEVSQEGVSYYTDSSLPQEGGNTVLYGHNKARILGGLVDMKKGDKIELRLDNGDIKIYEVSETKTIKSSEVSILNETEEPRLTIYTCTGFLDSARFVVIAKPV